MYGKLGVKGLKTETRSVFLVEKFPEDMSFQKYMTSMQWKSKATVTTECSFSNEDAEAQVELNRYIVNFARRQHCMLYKNVCNTHVSNITCTRMANIIVPVSSKKLLKIVFRSHFYV